MQAVAELGFDATVDEIARLSGVSPRTIFRHYKRHDMLILETVRDMFEACGLRPIENLPRPEDDLDGWIDGLARTIHSRNAEILGEAFWDIHAPHRKVSDALAEVAVMRRNWRRRGVRHLVELAWRHGGGAGAPPSELEMAFALNFSAFTTKALMVDFDRSPEQIAVLTADTLKLMLHQAVERSRKGPGAPGA